MRDDAHVSPEELIELALEEARLALEHGDVPIGAVVVRDADGEVLGRGHNERELRQDPTAHAELLALRRAAEAIGSWRVLGATLAITLEPCAMCAGAIVLARVPRIVYGCADPKAGAAGSVLDVLAEPRLNHRPLVVGGVLAEQCAAPLREFFGARRGSTRETTEEDEMGDGSFDEAKGRIKEAAGDLTDDEDLKNEGKVDQLAGNVKEKVGDLADKLKHAIRRDDN